MIRKGPRNLISDVAGVTVGHYTVDEPRHHTGVTVILPAPQEPFLFTHKLIAAGAVLNGYGKTQGLIQIDELGTLETPIALTNTLNIGKVHDALVQYMADEAKKRGVKLRSVNPVVGECNDSALNEITERVIEKEHVFAAIKSAGPEFALGDVGAGKGTTCFGLKGGIGSASRVFTVGEETYTLGVLVQSNHGKLEDLTVDGIRLGAGLAVRNLGENGREIPSTAPNFPADTDLLIVMLGTNDLLQGRSPEQAAERLERFLSGISLDRSKILVIAPPPMTLGAWVPSQQLIDDSHAFARLCQALAEHLGIRFADAGKWDILLAYDGVHFTEQGHRAFAAGLLEELK